MSLQRFRREVVTASEDDTVLSVAERMRDLRVGCVVVTRSDRPVGILTDRDLALRVVADRRDAATTKVSQVVTYDPMVVELDADISSVTALVREHGVRRFPIVDGSGALVGIVTSNDLFVLVGRELASLCAGLEDPSDTTESR